MNSTTQTVIGASMGVIGFGVCGYVLYLLVRSDGPPLPTDQEYLARFSQQSAAPAQGGKRRRKTRGNVHRLKFVQKKTKRVGSSH